jgi:hypothetical protein
MGADFRYSYGALAARKVGGVLQFFLTQNNVTTPRDQVAEILDPGVYDRDYTKAPTATLLTNWGNIYQDKRVSWTPAGAPSSIEPLVTPSLYWSPANNRLYWTYFNAYNVTQQNNWCLGLTDLKDKPASMVARGPWRPVGGPFHSSGWMVPMPDGSIGMGAGLQSGNSGSSWGPELIGGLTLPTDGTPAGFGAPDIALPYTYVRYYPASPDLNLDGTMMAGRVLKACPRNGSYVWHAPRASIMPNYLDPAKTAGRGSWLDCDWLSSCVYINLPDKAGIVFFGEQGSGDTWYGLPDDFSGDRCGGATGPHAHSYIPTWWIYDPAECSKVVTGMMKSWEIVPKQDFNPQTAIAPIATICGGGVLNNFGGAYFDEATRRLFVVALSADSTSSPGDYLPLIHVFRVN